MYILWGGIAVIFVWVIGSYNGLVTLKTRVKEALSDIDVQLKRRFDLIPNLVETVKGYMSHEANVLEKVTEARASVAQSKGNPLERDKAESALSGTLKTLFAVSENYPELKANTNFVELQCELSDTENKIQAARRFYNSNVREINIRVQRFPTNLIAGIFGFKVEPFFETEAGEKEPVKVQF
ncbi:MAG TPA: LemA family protein [Candidatus Colwellbacteria bacterium]|nr:LemA family protein [Candidatus Colwellbacteria bacterium]